PTATAVTATSAAAAAATALAPLVGWVHPKWTTVQHLPVHGVGSGCRLALRRVLDEAEAARSTRLPIDHDGRGDDLPLGRKRVLELLIHGAVREVPDVKTSTHGSSSFSAPTGSPSNGCSVPGNPFNDSPPRCGGGGRQNTTQTSRSGTDDRQHHVY